MKEKRKVLVAVNTLTSITMGAYWEHARMYYRLGRDCLNFDFLQCFSRRMSIDRFRNFAAQTAINCGCDYLFFVDDDMMLPHFTFKLLQKANYDIISALTYIRGYPFEIMAFKLDDMVERPRNLAFLKQEDLPNPLGPVINVEAIGTAVSLIKVSLLKKVQPPWFVTGPHSTEDVYFCLKARETVKRVKIGVHTGVITGHILEPEVISHYTREPLKKYYETFMEPAEIEATSCGGERGQEYAKENFGDVEETKENA